MLRSSRHSAISSFSGTTSIAGLSRGGADLLRSLDHVNERWPHVSPFPSLETTVRINPDLVRREMFFGLVEKASHFADGGYARRVDVVDTRADFIRIAVGNIKASRSSIRERDVSIEITSASIAPMELMMSLNSE